MASRASRRRESDFSSSLGGLRHIVSQQIEDGLRETIGNALVSRRREVNPVVRQRGIAEVEGPPEIEIAYRSIQLKTVAEHRPQRLLLGDPTVGKVRLIDDEHDRSLC